MAFFLPANPLPLSEMAIFDDNFGPCAVLFFMESMAYRVSGVRK